MGADIDCTGRVVREGRDWTSQITRQTEVAGVRHARRLHHAAYIHHRRIGHRVRSVDGIRADEGPTRIAQGIGVNFPGVGEGTRRVADRGAGRSSSQRTIGRYGHGAGRAAVVREGRHERQRMRADINRAGVVVREGRDRTCQITRQAEGAGIRDGRRLHHAPHLHRRRIGD